MSEHLAVKEAISPLSTLPGIPPAAAVGRVANAFAAAKVRLDGDLFDERGTAELRLAWVSAQTPLTTPHRFVAAAIEHHAPTELVPLITVCAMASMIQRFVAIAKPKVEDEVVAFLDHHRIPLDSSPSRA